MNEDLISRLRAVVAFLLGEAPLDGVWFGDATAGKRPFWWRKELRAAADALAAQPLPVKERTLRQMQDQVSKINRQRYMLKDLQRRLDEAQAALAAQPAQGGEPVALPYFDRREVEYQIELTENPAPGTLLLNDTKERVTLPGGTLRRMLSIIDMLAAPQPQRRLTDEEMPPLPEAQFCSWHGEQWKTTIRPDVVVNAFPHPPRVPEDEYWTAKGYHSKPLFTATQMRAYGRAVEAKLMKGER